MSLIKALKSIDENFKEVHVEERFHSYRNEQYENTCMEIAIRGERWYNEKKALHLNWYVPQDRYCMRFELYSDSEFIINTWDRTNSTHTWNEDFVIHFDIERSYFDCLNMVYPMTTNFKFKHLKLLKSISETYLEVRKP